MDDQGTWPVPLSADDGTDARAFNRQVMAEVRSDPQALQQIGGVRGNVLVVLVPFLAAIATVLLLIQWLRTDSALWLGILAVVLVIAVIIWISRIRAVMGQARQVLGRTVAGSVGYGIGIIRDVRIVSDDEDVTTVDSNDAPTADDIDTTLIGHDDAAPGIDERTRSPDATVAPEDRTRNEPQPVPSDPVPEVTAADVTESEAAASEADRSSEDQPTGAETAEDHDTEDLTSIRAHLTLAVTPARGKPFTATTVQRYSTIDALRLERGQHGPVRYIQRSPETTAAIETQLSPDAVQRLYRAAALNG